jgi:hypothetical protein
MCQHLRGYLQLSQPSSSTLQLWPCQPLEQQQLMVMAPHLHLQQQW